MIRPTKATGWHLSYGIVLKWFTAVWLLFQISFQEHKRTTDRKREKEWHSWHWKNDSQKPIVNVIIMIRWRGNPSVFPSVVCLRTCMCRRVCVWSYTRVRFMPVSPVSWHIFGVYVWVLCLDLVVIVFQTCGIFRTEWITPASMCCLPLQSLRGPINTGPELTTPPEIHQRQQDETKTGEAIIPATNNKHHIKDKNIFNWPKQCAICFCSNIFMTDLRGITVINRNCRARHEDRVHLNLENYSLFAHIHSGENS